MLYLLKNRSVKSDLQLKTAARDETDRIFGKAVYIRGLIEFTNICKNNCYYCGIRRGNNKAVRYRLSKEQILSCCTSGYSAGFRTFVLQGGEDAYFTDDRLCDIVSVSYTHLVKQMSRFIDFGEGKAIMANNKDWLDNLNYIDFLREIGVHLSLIHI